MFDVHVSLFYRRLRLDVMRHIELLCENVTSSTKPDVHNVSQRRPIKTEPRPQATCITNLVKLNSDCEVFGICERTDRQTDILITILRTPPGGEVAVDCSRENDNCCEYNKCINSVNILISSMQNIPLPGVSPFHTLPTF